MRILIAEDDPVSCRVLEAMLVKWGYDTVTARNGIEAWQILQSKDAPRLVILDWMMPGMNGPEICQNARELPDSQVTYIILLTARDRREDIIAGLQAGADDYVTKPFDREELRARLQVGARILELHRVKNELISIVSHELKSPLTSILNSLSLLANGETGRLPEQARKMVEIAYRNSERLLRMANDMLDIRKIESGKMEFYYQPLEMALPVKQAMEANSAYAKLFKVKFVLKDTSSGIRVNIDNDRMIRVLTNLLSNAVKFSPPNDTVVVSISRHNDSARVSITDHGPGIPEEFRHRIFQKFAQAHSSDERQKGGTGLGLSIARSLVEAMGGQIGFETEVDTGTTFYFDLPEYHALPPAENPS